MARWNHFRGQWNIGTVLRSLASGVLGHVDGGPKCASPIRKVAGCADSGWTSLYLKSTPLGEGLLPSKWEVSREIDTEAR